MSLLPTDPQERKYIMLGLRIVGDFGATIAVPVVLFVVLAQWLEGKYGGEPWLTIIAFVLAALITARLIVKKARAYSKEYQELNKPSNKQNK